MKLDVLDIIASTRPPCHDCQYDHQLLHQYHENYDQVKPDVLDIIASMGPRTAGRNQISPPDSGRQPGINILLVLITNICQTNYWNNLENC